jgi:hypothetical protein
VVSLSGTELAGLLADVELVDPGIVWAPLWRPDGSDAVVEQSAEAVIYGAEGSDHAPTPPAP